MSTTAIPFVPAMPMFDSAGNLTQTWRLFFQACATPQASSSPSAGGATSLLINPVQLTAGALDVASPQTPVSNLGLIVLLKQDSVGGRQPVWDAAYAGQPAALRGSAASTYSSVLFVGDIDSSDNPVWRFLAMLNENIPLT